MQRIYILKRDTFFALGVLPSIPAKEKWVGNSRCCLFIIVCLFADISERLRRLVGGGKGVLGFQIWDVGLEAVGRFGNGWA